MAMSTEEIQKCLPEKQPTETKDFMFQQTMYRIKDPKRSVKFYSEVLGMSLLSKIDMPEGKFTLYFMGYEDVNEAPSASLTSTERKRWALSRKATIELTHNWGDESNDQLTYHSGNKDPRGFGHIGILVPDVEKACERFEKLGVNFIKRPNDGRMKGLAFITDPDGYWIEIFNNMNVVLIQSFILVVYTIVGYVVCYYSYIKFYIDLSEDI